MSELIEYLYKNKYINKSNRLFLYNLINNKYSLSNLYFKGFDKLYLHSKNKNLPINYKELNKEKNPVITNQVITNISKILLPKPVKAFRIVGSLVTNNFSNFKYKAITENNDNFIKIYSIPREKKKDIDIEIISDKFSSYDIEYLNNELQNVIYKFNNEFRFSVLILNYNKIFYKNKHTLFNSNLNVTTLFEPYFRFALLGGYVCIKGYNTYIKLQKNYSQILKNIDTTFLNEVIFEFLIIHHLKALAKKDNIVLNIPANLIKYKELLQGNGEIFAAELKYDLQ